MAEANASCNQWLGTFFWFRVLGEERVALSNHVGYAFGRSSSLEMGMCFRQKKKEKGREEAFLFRVNSLERSDCPNEGLNIVRVTGLA